MCDKCEGTGFLQGVQNTVTEEVIRLPSTMGTGEICVKYKYPEWAIIAQECPCRQIQRATQQIAAAHMSVPKDVQQQTFEGFETLQHAKLALSFARLMADRQPTIEWQGKVKAGLLLMGGTGTGKSSLAFVVYKMRSEAGERCVWANFMDLLNRVRETYDDDYQGVSVAALLAPICKAPFLVLDDVGSETRKTEMAEDAIETIRQIVDFRFNQALPTIITTNLDANEKLRVQFGDRVWSRVMGLCHVVQMDGIDMRTGTVNAPLKLVRR